MEEARGAHLAISQRLTNLRAKEADLHKLREAAAMVAVEDEDSEVEEVDEAEVASTQDSHDPCAMAITNREARYEACKGDFQGACTSAVQATSDALCAAVMAEIVKDCERERKQSTAAANRVAARVRAAAPLARLRN
jgi:hypothetical protein